VLLGYKARWGAIALIIFFRPHSHFPYEFCRRNAGDSVREEFGDVGGTADGGLLGIRSSQVSNQNLNRARDKSCHRRTQNKLPSLDRCRDHSMPLLQLALQRDLGPAFDPGNL